MTKTKIAVWVIGIVLFFALLAAVDRALKPEAAPAPAPPPRAASPAAAPAPAAAPGDAPKAGYIYGRVTVVNGATYEGRLRWGPDEEAFWTDAFNGVKHENAWATHVPPERLPKRSNQHKVFGIQIGHGERPIDLGRMFLVRFGDIARIEPRGRSVVVVLKSGTEFVLDRFSSSDFDDDLRVWDATKGEVDMDSAQIRSIELMPTGPLGEVAGRLYGTVHTKHRDFTGFVQWDREECMGTDELDGRGPEGKLSVRFDTIRSIERRTPDSSLVTQLDGREVVIGGTNDVGNGNRGVYVDDQRYGRVLVSWDAFERVDFGPAGSGPAYGDFPPSSPITGSVTTRDGRRLTGRLVYDLDESETIETLDLPMDGVDYSIPFGMVASIVPLGADVQGAQHPRVTLHNGEVLQPERESDVGEWNAGLLVFVEGVEHPEYVAWGEVQQVDFNRPPAMYPPLEKF